MENSWQFWKICSPHPNRGPTEDWEKGLCQLVVVPIEGALNHMLGSEWIKKVVRNTVTAPSLQNDILGSGMKAEYGMQYIQKWKHWPKSELCLMTSRLGTAQGQSCKYPCSALPHAPSREIPPHLPSICNRFLRLHTGLKGKGQHDNEKSVGPRKSC